MESDMRLAPGLPTVPRPAHAARRARLL